MRHLHVCRALALVLLSGPAADLRCEAMLYRCPARSGDGMVVTNLVDDATARDRACERIKERVSPIDAPLTDRGAAGAPGDMAKKIGEEWMNGSASRAAPPSTLRARPTSAAAARDPRPDGEAERRRILEEELHTEERALAQARASAAPAPVIAPSSATSPALRPPIPPDDAEFALAMRLQGGARDAMRERQAFEEGKALARRQASFDDAVHRHVENIEALKREINRTH